MESEIKNSIKSTVDSLGTQGYPLEFVDILKKVSDYVIKSTGNDFLSKANSFQLFLNNIDIVKKNVGGQLRVDTKDIKGDLSVEEFIDKLPDDLKPAINDTPINSEVLPQKSQKPVSSLKPVAAKPPVKSKVLPAPSVAAPPIVKSDVLPPSLSSKEIPRGKYYNEFYSDSIKNGESLYDTISSAIEERKILNNVTLSNESNVVIRAKLFYIRKNIENMTDTNRIKNIHDINLKLAQIYEKLPTYVNSEVSKINQEVTGTRLESSKKDVETRLSNLQTYKKQLNSKISPEVMKKIEEIENEVKQQVKSMDNMGIQEIKQILNKIIQATDLVRYGYSNPPRNTEKPKDWEDAITKYDKEFPGLAESVKRIIRDILN